MHCTTPTYYPLEDGHAPGWRYVFGDVSYTILLPRAGEKTDELCCRVGNMIGKAVTCSHTERTDWSVGYVHAGEMSDTARGDSFGEAVRQLLPPASDSETLTRLAFLSAVRSGLGWG